MNLISVAPILGVILLLIAGMVLSLALTRGADFRARSRTAFVFIGVVLVAVGVVALLGNLRLITFDWQRVWAVSWPIAVAAFGIALIAEALRAL